MHHQKLRGIMVTMVICLVCCGLVAFSRYRPVTFLRSVVDNVAKLCVLQRDYAEDGRPRAVIYYLTQSSRLGNLSASLASLDANFNNQFHYPVVIFYEASDAAFSEDSVRNSTTSLVFFQQVTFRLPPFINTTLLPKKRGCAGKRPIGYRHMCRFHAYCVHREPIMSCVDYALRLDDDSFIQSPVGYDIFEFVRRKGIKYAYTDEVDELPQCILGLYDAVDNYVNRTSLTPTFYRQWPRFRMFYNNFELSSLALWRSNEYADFIEYIDKLGGIYYHRWGDAPIKTFAVTLFVPRNETHMFRISYRHLGISFPEHVPGWIN